MCKKVHPAEALQPGDAYDIIAGLDLPMYITTNYDDLLMHALRNRRKTPQALLCPWQSFTRCSGQKRRTVPHLVPQKPAVYYLHGSAGGAQLYCDN